MCTAHRWTIVHTLRNTDVSRDLRAWSEQRPQPYTMHLLDLSFGINARDGDMMWIISVFDDAQRSRVHHG